jgi:DNA-binding transcriptional LysR family regulator
VELSDIPDFLAAFRERSLTRAARRRQVNQSTMSRRLREIEGRVGHLFDRIPEGLAPTALALRIAPFAERVEAESLVLQRALVGPALIEGVVRVAVAEAVAVYLLLPNLAALRAAHPDLHVEFIIGQSLVDLQRGEADMAVRHIPTSRGDLITRLAAKTNYAVLAHRDLAATLGDEPKDWPWLSVSRDLGHLPEAVWFDRYIGADPVIRTNGYVLRLEALRLGLGVVLASRTVAEHPDIVALDLGFPLCKPGPIWLVTHADLRHVPRVSAVWDFLLDALKGA